MQKQRIILIVGLVLALIAAYMITVYLDQQRQAIKREEIRKAEKLRQNQTPVLVAKADIPRGSVISADNLEVRITPNQYVQPQAVTSLDRVAGMTTITPISTGEQITLNKLARPRQVGGLAEATPVGKRAITISVDSIASLAGMVKAGDYVDVIAMISMPVQTPEGKQVAQTAVIPLFQKVLVLAVGQQLNASSPESDSRYRQQETRGPSSPPLITLALTPQEATLIAFVQEQGKIRLTMRSPADTQTQPLRPTSWEALFAYLMPKEEAKPEQKAEVKPTEYVEIYRGLKKERVPLSQ